VLELLSISQSLYTEQSIYTIYVKKVKNKNKNKKLSPLIPKIYSLLPIWTALGSITESNASLHQRHNREVDIEFQLTFPKYPARVGVRDPRPVSSLVIGKPLSRLVHGRPLAFAKYDHITGTWLTPGNTDRENKTRQHMLARLCCNSDYKHMSSLALCSADTWAHRARQSSGIRILFMSTV